MLNDLSPNRISSDAIAKIMAQRSQPLNVRTHNAIHTTSVEVSDRKPLIKNQGDMLRANVVWNIRQANRLAKLILVILNVEENLSYDVNVAFHGDVIMRANDHKLRHSRRDSRLNETMNGKLPISVENCEGGGCCLQRGVRMRLCPTTLRKANDFVAKYHRHNGRTARNGGKWACAVEIGGEIVGVAIVGNPLSATLMDGYTAEVLRVCVNDRAQKGACSMLYQACWRAWKAMGGRRLITYTLQTESGASLRGAGWKIVGQTKPCKPGWRKNDDLNGEREYAPVMGLVKHRWQAS